MRKKALAFASFVMIFITSLALFTPPIASAYCAAPVYTWKSSELSIRGWTVPTAWNAALTSAASAWSNVPSAAWSVVYFVPGYTGPTGSPVVGAYRQATAPPGFAGAPATVDLQLSGNAITNGNIFFSNKYTWNTNGNFSQANKKADVRTVATHELGHEVYLNHPSSCGTPLTTQEQNANMNPDWTQKWGLKKDDKAGLQVRK